MKRPEREPDQMPSDSAGPWAFGQAKWAAQEGAWQGIPAEQYGDEQEELLSANPLEWWADSEASEAARFATSPLLSVDAITAGPLPDLYQNFAPPAQRHNAGRFYPSTFDSPEIQFPGEPHDRRESGAERFSSYASPPNKPTLSSAPDASSHQVAGNLSGRMDATHPKIAAAQAPLERDDTSYLPAWKVSTARMPAIVARAETVFVIVRRLMKSSGLYAVAALGTPAVSLALTPYLAHNMAVSDYGLLAVLNTSISLFAGLTQLGLGSAFFRAYNYDFTSAIERKSVLATSSLLMLMLSALFLLITLPLAPFLAELLVRGGGAVVEQEVRIACLVIAFQNLSVPGFAWLRAEDRALAFSLISMMNVLVTLGASIILVGVLHQGIAGAMIANGAGYAAAVVGTLIPMLVRSQLRFSPSVARSMLSFGAPLTLSVISVWVLQLSDRYLLAFFGDFKAVASYSVAYSLGAVISTIVLAPFSLAWPTAMYSIAKRADAPRVYQQVFRWFTAVLLFAAFGLSLASTVLLDVLFPPSYRVAAPVIPVVAASIALYGTYTVLMVGANVKRKTWMTSVFTAIAAIVNVGLNLVLIPQFGAMGAAAATFFAYLALVVVAYFANQRIYPIPYEVSRAFFAGLMGIALFYLISELPDVLSQQLGALGPSLGPSQSESYVALALSVVGLLVYGMWLYMLLQIRTISFRVNPAIMRRLTRRDTPHAARLDLSGETYVRR